MWIRDEDCEFDRVCEQTSVQIESCLHEEVWSDSNDISPTLWRHKLSLYSNKMFGAYRKRLTEDCELGKTTNETRPKSIDRSDEGDDEGDLARLAEHSVIANNSIGLSTNQLRRGPKKIVDMIPKSCSRAVIGSVDDVVGVLSETGGVVTMVALHTVEFAYDLVKNIRRWWRGDISGKRCAKNIIDSGVAIGAGVGGGVLGAIIGSPLGPIGIMFAGIVGGVLFEETAKNLIEWLTQLIFGLPKNEALEKAYSQMGVTASSSDHDINTAFRRLCLQHHPDKGGDHEQFIIVQYNMAIIKAARRQL